MQQTLKMGSQGPPVYDLQAKLNCFPPSSFPQLAIDGMFGPKTFARVKEFQRNSELSADGIVGPLTWGELNEGIDLPAPRPARCSNCHPQNNIVAGQFQSALTQLLRRPAATPSNRRLSFAGSASRSSLVTPVLPSMIAGAKVEPLSQMQRDVANARFGASLDLDGIFITDKTGVGGRPFTLAIAVPIGSPFNGVLPLVVFLNMGTLTPNGNTLIHELAHAWQAQHHANPAQYMENSVKSQALAIALNTPIGIFDSAARGHASFPTLFPFSPYAYVPGKPFGEYCAEQIASQVEDNEPSISAYVKSVTRGQPDSLNAMSLSTARAEDRRKPGVK